MAWKNSEDARAYNRAYRLANGDEINARRRAKYQTEAGTEVGRARNHERRRREYAANRDEMLARSRDYRTKNRDAINARRRAQRAADPEKYRARERGRHVDPVRHRAISIKHLHGLSPDEWGALWKQQDGRCYLCQRDLDAQDSRRVHMDHDHDHCPGKRSCRICQRGLACERCNKLIALADDDPTRLRLIAANLRAAGAAVRTRVVNAPRQLAFDA